MASTSVVENNLSCDLSWSPHSFVFILVKKEKSQKKCLAWNWPFFPSWQNMEKGRNRLVKAAT